LKRALSSAPEARYEVQDAFTVGGREKRVDQVDPALLAA